MVNRKNPSGLCPRTKESVDAQLRRSPACLSTLPLAQSALTVYCVRMCLLTLRFDFSNDLAFSWTFVFDSLPDNLDCALFSVIPYDLAVWFIGLTMAGRRRSFSNEEYADILFYYGVARGNAEQARREYAEIFPDRRLPDARVFSRTFRRVRVRGTFERYQGKRKLLLLKRVQIRDCSIQNVVPKRAALH